MLLNKQTSVEIQKEQSIKFIDLKTRTYEELINQIEEISQSEKIDNSDMIRIQFITHRLAIFSSPPVLKEFQKFLEILDTRTKDRRISRDDSRILAESLANLTVKIREDLIGEMDTLGNYSQEQIKKTDPSKL